MNMADAIVPKSDQINADDLIGRDMTITIRDVQIRGGQEQPVSMAFDGSDKVYRPCKSMSRVLVACWGADARQYLGRSMTLYRDPTVKWGGLDVGGIRISHLSHITEAKTMALTATKGSRKPYTVKPLQVPAGDAGISAADALADMEAAESLDDLSTVWRRRVMAPHRDALQADLDRIKARFASNEPEQGRATEDMGEAHNDSPDDLIDFINRKEFVADVNSVVASWADKMAAFDEADVLRVEKAKADRIAELKGRV